MLEGAVARLLNQLLGKYVVDLDTENLNVGIFSGHVQLTDLKLKPEALYELNLPIEVKAGTIGKVWLQIPWNLLWSQPVIVDVEDVHIVAGPIVTREKFDPEKNKRLLRAAKRNVLSNLNNGNELIGGPCSFSEYLITNIINNLQLNIANIHLRYEDSVSDKFPLACGICISSITAETTNNKWKASKNVKNGDTCYYLIKIEAFSMYWNVNHKLTEWNLPSQYYSWRNAMSTSLQNFSINQQDFDFLIKPMTAKIKMTINKANSGNIVKLHSDIIIQDCSVQVSKDQFQSIFCVADSLSRMVISWNFLFMRPKQTVSENRKIWWRYAYHALMEQRIKPYTWSRIRTVRQHYKYYTELYKKILLNPNDTELKMDLQKYEDQLSVVNIVIARQQARLTVHESSLTEKSFWDILPSPERSILCEKIGFSCADKQIIEHNYNFRVGNISISLLNSGREVLVVTVTQLISNLQPNFANGTFRASLKIEAVIVEGASVEEHLVPIVSSEHLTVHNSPAYFLKVDVEKLPANSSVTHKLRCILEYLEVSYHKHAFDELKSFLENPYVNFEEVVERLKRVPPAVFSYAQEKLKQKWDMNFDLKIPYFIVPQCASLQTGENILVVDFGHVLVTTELCQATDITENSTQMELEEQLYSRLHLKCSDSQILFCDSCEDWRAGRKEKDTELHVLSKTNLSAIYAACMKSLKTIPKQKLTITFSTIKVNVSERKIGVFLKFLDSLLESRGTPAKTKPKSIHWPKDGIRVKWTHKYLLHVQNTVTIIDTFIKTRRTKLEKGSASKDKRMSQVSYRKENMNEAWARCVDLPGLEDNISPNNNISSLLQCIINELQLVFSKSSDSTDRHYIVLRLGMFTMDLALMTYGPAYQISLNSILVTDKMHTTPSGQYLDLVHSPLPSNIDVLTVLYRKVSASCPDFWTHFHGVETSLVADFGTLNLMLHQEAVHTIIKYTRYIKQKIEKQVTRSVAEAFLALFQSLKRSVKTKIPETPVPPGSVKFSHSARLGDVHIRVCDSDYDIVNVQVSGLEVDFLFRANERFVFRAFLGGLNVEHLSDITLYSKVLSTDEDKVFEVKYIRYASHLHQKNDISPTTNDILADGSFKLYLGQIHITFLYKLFVQLNRFVANLEAVSYIENVVAFIRSAVAKATETLKNSTKINLAVNLKGPVLLFPQKSSSPNVVIINTGEFNVENFFKDYPNDTVENILLKINGITVSRGVMTLSSTLEMQEIIVEPVNLNMDIKRYTPSLKSAIKNQFWDIDGVMDTMQITLGQRDLSTILAIHADNIGEGKLLDLFPVPIKQPVPAVEVDETVRSLEAFFCEPKQKHVMMKFCFDGINFLLFFDSGEQLSSPIRDLNHGLCKFEMTDISTSFVLFTDGCLDGKLSVDVLAIEEIGPDANIFDKGILQSPIDDNKNNNCNITVNKPPIIDITFHQTKAGDKSIDIIIGRLSLSLSVPFSEKLAMFVLECLPKDTIDTGFINHGYVGDQVSENAVVKTLPASITIALRINRPEFIFIVETTSNKKRYFITKTEILCDYSRHANRLNLVISLSGLHSLFYDVGINSMEPYTLLKQCDIELSKSFSEEKGNKITATVSSIYVQFCSRVVYSINDILNDIIEHFKIPESEVVSVKEFKPVQTNVPDDIWEPRNLSEYICKGPEDFAETKAASAVAIHEIFLLPKTDIIVVLELEDIPVVLLKTTIEMTMYDWSSLLNCTCEITAQANYFNEDVQNWEPIIDPVMLDEYEYKMWEVNVKIFQDKSLPMLNHPESKPKKDANKDKKSASSSSTEEEEDSGDDMVYLQPTNTFHNRSNMKVKTSLSTFLDDTDSENEDGTMEKLASAISDLFTGDWNESDGSESEHSSEGEEESEDDVKMKPPDAGAEQAANYKKSTYILVDTKDILNITLTPTFLKLLNELFTVYSNKTLSIVSNKKTINLVNDIGPHTKIELFENRGAKNAENSVLMCSKTYEMQDSCPNSPTKNLYGGTSEFSEDTNEDRDSYTDEISKIDVEMGYDSEATSSLEFPISTTPLLYEKINRHHLKIHVPGFQPLQTSCPKKTWKKLMRLHSLSSNQIYYLVARHKIGKHGRMVVISSPLQIRNETCFALSVLYEPSILQQMNLEPVGDITNPFETTMRIAVLEPHERYNVPLHIAYHCKLFIQPAYAEGHYLSDCGIWWQDLANELDTAHNFHCSPKSDSNLEVFSLRVMLKRNVDTKKSHAHFIPNYIIHLLPPLILHNFLPYTLEVQNIDLKQHMKVEPGESSSAYSLNLSKDQKLQIKVCYSNLVWSGNLNLTTHLDEKVVHLSSDVKGDDNLKHLAVHVKTDREGSCNIFFYAPYWIVNKTGLPLQVKASSANIIYDTSSEDILLFSYKRHGKQTVNLKVYESDWSNDFGVECAGTTGLVVCKDNERKKRYSFLLSVKLSQMCPRFTKIVTLSPNFLVTNGTSKTLRFMEQNEKTDLWIDLQPGQCAPFWPETSSMQMCVKHRDSKVSSQPFFISTNHHTVLRMDKGSAICVDVSGGRTDCFRIVFNKYKEGDAPVLVKNLCADLFLKIQQQGQGQVTLLNPFHSLLYTWDDPTKTRQLVWNVYNNKGFGFHVDILKDCYGEEKINFHSVAPGNASQISPPSSSSDDSDSCDSVKTTLNKKVRRDKIAIYWICFRDGLQKILLFTQDQRVYNEILSTAFMDQCDIECLVSLCGIGVSIFTPNCLTKEHIYLSLVDAPAIWEVNVGHKWKTLTLELASWIEDKYRLPYKKCQLKDYIHIDFEKMFMLKPFYAELKRIYNPAFYLQLRKSANHLYVNCKIQSVQADNKQCTSSDSIILHPLPMDAMKVASAVEFSCFKSNFKDVDVYKQIQLNVEDLYVSIESDLILQLSKLLKGNRKCKAECPLLYRNDLSQIRAPLVLPSKDNQAANVLIENLHVSQTGVQLNISHKNRALLNNDGYPVTKILDYLFPSNLSPYMPGEGVRHKINPLEIIDTKKTFMNVLSDIWVHVSSQFLQQYYSQVLGQQVLVNPYAIQAIPTSEKTIGDCEKISNVVLFGCRCFLGHINMSSAALEQCIMDIFANQNMENLQRIRRHSSYHKSSTIPKSVVASSKSFNPGVVLALEQIITKNRSGLQCDGEVFFRGTGKALYSLITRHPDDKSNSVQVALEALRRANILGEPVRIHQRVTRFCNTYLGLKPFSIFESMGHHLLETVANNRFMNDTYWAHSATDKTGKSILLISLEHIVRINKCRLWGHWELEWALDLDDVVSVPQVTSNELVFNIRQGEANFENTSGKLTVAGHKEMLIWLQEKVEQAMVVSMEDKSWAITDN